MKTITNALVLAITIVVSSLALTIIWYLSYPHFGKWLD